MNYEYKQNCQLNETEIVKSMYKLEDYAAALKEVTKSSTYNQYESVLNLPFDEANVKEILTTKKKYETPDLKYIILIGIGGSDLGTKAIYDAIYGYYDILQPERYPKLIVLDTINPAFREKLVDFIEKHVRHPDEIIINAISKSGITLETNDNLEFLMHHLPYINKRLVLTTAPNTAFWKMCDEKGVKCLKIEQKVSGRYSFFSPVGLFPLSLLDLKFNSILEGGMKAVHDGTQTDVNHNLAITSAAVNYLEYLGGKKIHITFMFHPELESLGKWNAQLVAESLGKEKNTEGQIVNEGITPVVSIGTNDLHSLEQLYLSGPKDKFTTFVYTQQLKNNKALYAVLEGVKKAHLNRGLPFSEIILDDKSPKELAYFMQYKMLETMYMAKLMDINAFDQPNVEEYKKEAQKYL